MLSNLYTIHHIAFLKPKNKKKHKPQNPSGPKDPGKSPVDLHSLTNPKAQVLLSLYIPQTSSEPRVEWTVLCKLKSQISRQPAHLQNQGHYGQDDVVHGPPSSKPLDSYITGTHLTFSEKPRLCGSFQGVVVGVCVLVLQKACSHLNDIHACLCAYVCVCV